MKYLAGTIAFQKRTGEALLGAPLLSERQLVEAEQTLRRRKEYGAEDPLENYVPRGDLAAREAQAFGSGARLDRRSETAELEMESYLNDYRGFTWLMGDGHD